MELGEQHDYAWPPRSVFAAWCELRWRWCEEMRLIHQRLLEVLDEESPSYDRIRFVCTSPRRGWLALAKVAQDV